MITISKLRKKFGDMDIISIGDQGMVDSAQALDNLLARWDRGDHSLKLEQYIRSRYSALAHKYAALKRAQKRRFCKQEQQECGMGMHTPQRELSDTFD